MNGGKAESLTWKQGKESRKTKIENSVAKGKFRDCPEKTGQQRNRERERGVSEALSVVCHFSTRNEEVKLGRGSPTVAHDDNNTL